MAKICLCLTGKTIQRNIEILNKYRNFADMAELRVDCLEPDERLLIRRFPEIAGLPVILTIRRVSDGGFYSGGEGNRIKLLARGLAFANADTRLNFAYVDIEEDIEVPSLEEAARIFGTKIIRSYHNFDGSCINGLAAKMKSMQRAGDEIIKAAVAVKTTKEVQGVYHAAKSCTAGEKIIVCMGHHGIYSRILAEKFGSFMTYSSALSEGETAGAPGQLDVQELSQLYRFHKITNKTVVYGIIGYPLKSTISPWFFNTVFGMENADAVYVPFPVDSVSDFLNLANDLEVKGLSVTVPYKEDIIPLLAKCSPVVQSIGACNTMYHFTDGWFGENTDCSGFSFSLLNFINQKNLKRQKITIVGAGGVARAAAAEIHRLGGKALIVNRTVYKARNLAAPYDFRWAGIDENGIGLISKFNDIIIQTTSVGMEGYEAADPLSIYSYTGKEAVMDLIYTPPQTPFLKRAAAAGCKTINGYDMVIRQACLQYSNFIGRDMPPKFLSLINRKGDDAWNKIRTG